MNVAEFREKIKLDCVLEIEGKEYSIREIVKFRFDDGNFYMKLFLDDSFVLADDSNTDSFVFVKLTDTDIAEPFPKKIVFDNKEFNFLFDAHATAEEVEGEKIFEKGESETFWDYESSDGSYLSLGMDDKTQKRMDFYGKILKGEDIEIKNL